jgi:uncharacterized membrane protein HdeD (DUF308 family)
MESGLSRVWWALALRGVVAILFGVLAFVWPGLTLTVLVLLWGAFALVDGVLALALLLSGEAPAGRWWAFVLEGIFGIAAGILTFFWPDITAFALVLVIASWAVATGVFEIIAAIRLRRYIEGEWLLALAGVLSVLLGVLLFLFPGPGALALIYWIAAWSIAFGILLLALGFRLRAGLRSRAPRPAAF